MKTKQTILFLLLVSVGATLLAQADTSFTGLGDLSGGTFDSTAYGVSADGSTVIGRSVGPYGSHAFRWTASGGMQNLSPYYSWAQATGVSADGSSVVVYNLRSAFRWSAAEGLQSLGDLSGGQVFTYAGPISSDGSTVMGHSSSSTGTEAFRWTVSSGMQPISDLPVDSIIKGLSADGSTAAGFLNNGSYEAFRWTESSGMLTLGDLSGGSSYTSPANISADGSTIVGYSGGSNGTEAFRWTELEGMQGLGDLSGGDSHSYAYDVSANGSTIVGYGTTENGKEAFIWNEADGMLLLQDVLEDSGVGVDGWTLQYATGISDNGKTIVGYGINPEGNREAFLTVIPEPMSASLILLLFPLMIIRRNFCSVNKRGSGRLYMQLNKLFSQFYLKPTKGSPLQDKWTDNVR